VPLVINVSILNEIIKILKNMFLDVFWAKESENVVKFYKFPLFGYFIA
jgi:flavoprotein